LIEAELDGWLELGLDLRSIDGGIPIIEAKYGDAP
jgi:hypothetical protein